MARTMYDSTNPYDIPTSAAMVAGYVDGLYAWPDAGWQRFPGARKVTITVGSGTLDANVADIENGDYTPATAAQWAAAKLAAGSTPTLYFSLGNYPAIQAALAAAGVPAGRVLVWVADWNGVAALEYTWTAKQYADSAMTGHHYDLSVVSDYWPDVDPPPGYAPPPPPLGLPEQEVQIAWAKLGDVLGSVLPSLNDRLVGTGVSLGEL